VVEFVFIGTSSELEPIGICNSGDPRRKGTLIFYLIRLSNFDPIRLVRMVKEIGRLTGEHPKFPSLPQLPPKGGSWAAGFPGFRGADSK
jgi:hypothetical protein